MAGQNFANIREQAQPGVHGAAAELFDLQVEQFHHDENYHREIARLTVHHRLNHMALHFAKYVGAIAGHVSGQLDEKTLDRALVDGFIIALSTSNILNQRISDRIMKQGGPFTNLTALAWHCAREERIDSFDPNWLLKRIAVPVGRMAKACESIDHLEAFPFRDAVTDALAETTRTLLAAMALRRIDPTSAVRSRLKDVKKKSIFHTAT